MGFCKIDGPNPVLTGLRFASISQPQVETWGYYKFVPPGLLRMEITPGYLPRLTLANPF